MSDGKFRKKKEKKVLISPPNLKLITKEDSVFIDYLTDVFIHTNEKGESLMYFEQIMIYDKFVEFIEKNKNNTITIELTYKTVDLKCNRLPDTTYEYKNMFLANVINQSIIEKSIKDIYIFTNMSNKEEINNCINQILKKEEMDNLKETIYKLRSNRELNDIYSELREVKGLIKELVNVLDRPKEINIKNDIPIKLNEETLNKMMTKAISNSMSRYSGRK